MSREQQFTAFAQSVVPGLLRRAELLTGELHAAEDLVQDTLAKLYVHWPKVDAAVNPAAYAHTALYRTFCSGRRRASSGEVPMADPPDTASADHTIDLAIDLRVALAALKPVERCVVVARYLDDRPVEEVATMLNRTQTWVRTTSHRALQRLRVNPSLDPTGAVS